MVVETKCKLFAMWIQILDLNMCYVHRSVPVLIFGVPKDLLLLMSARFINITALLRKASGHCISSKMIIEPI